MGDKMDDTKKVPAWMIVAIIMILVTVAISIALWFLGQQVAAVLVAVLLACMITAIVVSWCVARLLREGAHIALLAQKSDDERDVQLLKTVTDMSKVWRQVQSELPALPMPGQKDGWLCEFSEGEYEEVN